MYSRAPTTSVGELIPNYREVDARTHLLRQVSGEPFDNPDVLPTMYTVASQLNDRLGVYDLVVGEDTGGRLPALFMWRLVNARREEAGLERATIGFLDGRYEGILPVGTIPAPSTEDARALVVTESIIHGTSLMRTYGQVTRGRQASSVDVMSLAKGFPDAKLTFDAGTRFATVGRLGEASMDGYFFGYRDGSKGVMRSPGQPHTIRQPKGVFNNVRVREARSDIRLAARLLYPLLAGSLRQQVQV